MLMVIAVIISDINRVRTCRRPSLNNYTSLDALKMSRVDTRRNVKRIYMCVHVLWINNDRCYCTGVREKHIMYNELEIIIWEKNSILLNCFKRDGLQLQKYMKRERIRLVFSQTYSLSTIYWDSFKLMAFLCRSFSFTKFF